MIPDALKLARVALGSDADPTDPLHAQVQADLARLQQLDHRSVELGPLVQAALDADLDRAEALIRERIAIITERGEITERLRALPLGKRLATETRQ